MTFRRPSTTEAWTRVIPHACTRFPAVVLQHFNSTNCPISLQSELQKSHPRLATGGALWRGSTRLPPHRPTPAQGHAHVPLRVLLRLGVHTRSAHCLLQKALLAQTDYGDHFLLNAWRPSGTPWHFLAAAAGALRASHVPAEAPSLHRCLTRSGAPANLCGISPCEQSTSFQQQTAVRPGGCACPDTYDGKPGCELHWSFTFLTNA